MPWAFDLFELNGEDLRQLMLDEHKSIGETAERISPLHQSERLVVFNRNSWSPSPGACSHYGIVLLAECSTICVLGFEGIV
jgi:hypothetical protein